MKFLSLIAAAFLLLIPGIARAEMAPVTEGSQTAIFAGGCFWCMESEFSHLKGVSDVTSGYAGGVGPAPTYEQVSTGTTGFKESISVTYDPKVVSYEKLLDVFWSNVDPFDDKGQFCDKGTQYVAAIFYASPEEKSLAEKSLKTVEAKFPGKPVATQILPKTTFYRAEEHHQDYYKKSTLSYKLYRSGCGRDGVLDKLWGDKARTGGAAEQ